jgi:hypothetical protein
VEWCSQTFDVLLSWKFFTGEVILYKFLEGRFSISRPVGFFCYLMFIKPQNIKVNFVMYVEELKHIY